jgi:ABC-type uncharacterized transport system permease subunit
MPLVWLRVAVGCYGVGLVYALLLLTRRADRLAKVVMPIAATGLVFHFVSLVEAWQLAPGLEVISFHQFASLLAFLVMLFFFVVYARWRVTAPGMFVFPLVFLMTFGAAIGQNPPQFTSEQLKSWWLYLHIALIFAGYAALFLSCGASFLYLLQERQLKSRQPGGLLGRLPALATIDDIGYRSLLWGFPFMTLGLIAGSIVVARANLGFNYFLDPKIVLSVLMWLVYIVLIYTRVSSGWRGRKAAYLSTTAFLIALVVWAANVFSRVHRFMPQ